MIYITNNSYNNNNKITFKILKLKQYNQIKFISQKFQKYNRSFKMKFKVRISNRMIITKK